MIRLVILVGLPLAVYLLSDTTASKSNKTTEHKTVTTTKKPSSKQTASQPLDTPKPIEDLFLEDDDFDITDLINADRRNK